MPHLEVKRDQWDRPIVPDPTTNKMKAFTRVSTLADTLSDRFALEQWTQRKLLRGLVLRDDLRLRAAAAGEDDKKELNRIVKSALEAAEAYASADRGTALHSLTEQIDSGQDPVVPADYQADLRAYKKALTDGHVTIEPGWIERFVINQSVSAAGTPDRLVRVKGYDLPMIADLKTGRDLSYKQVSIAIQLAVYANANHWWDGKKLYRIPPIDLERALVIHMPAGEGTCELSFVDIKWGWEQAKLAHQVREVRKHKPFISFAPGVTHDKAVENIKSGLSVESVKETESSADGEPLPLQTNVGELANENIRKRVQAVKDALGESPLPYPWPDSVKPPSRQGDAPYVRKELSVIKGWLGEIEHAIGITPF
jgi:hypothetical protein